jgi:hypothetical protein
MPRRPAIITQADVARAIRAARQAGASKVEIRPDGTIVILLSAQSTGERDRQLDPRPEIVL